MYGTEVFDGETARFEVELSEDDVHGQWKLSGEVLSPSAVCLTKTLLYRYSLTCGSIHFHFDSSHFGVHSHRMEKKFEIPDITNRVGDIWYDNV